MKKTIIKYTVYALVLLCLLFTILVKRAHSRLRSSGQTQHNFEICVVGGTTTQAKKEMEACLTSEGITIVHGPYEIEGVTVRDNSGKALELLKAQFPTRRVYEESPDTAILCNSCSNSGKRETIATVLEKNGIAVWYNIKDPCAVVVPRNEANVAMIVLSNTCPSIKCHVGFQGEIYIESWK